MLRFKKALLITLPSLLTVLGLGYALFKQKQTVKPDPAANETELHEIWDEPAEGFTWPADTGETIKENADVAVNTTTPENNEPAAQESLTLAQAEAQLQELAGDLSDLPLWQKWLAQTKPLQRVVIAMEALALGERPVQALDFMLPQKPFAAEKKGGQWRQNQVSCQRFAAATQLFCSLNPTRCATLYLYLEPALQEACRALGYQDKKVRDLLTEACSTILSAPILEEEPPLIKGGREGIYYWQNAELENLNAAQKLFLRMGHENAAKVRSQVEAIAMELKLYRED